MIRSESPFLVGIDLGTTNSAVAFVDTRRGGRVQLFRVPQLTAPGRVDPYPVLPSFLFFPDAHELESGALATPWFKDPSAVLADRSQALTDTAAARREHALLHAPAHPKRAANIDLAVARCA